MATRDEEEALLGVAEAMGLALFGTALDAFAHSGCCRHSGGKDCKSLPGLTTIE